MVSLVASLWIGACASGGRPVPAGTVTVDTFGVLPSGEVVERYTLENGNGVKLSAITYGGIIASLIVPDRDGRMDDVVLGHDDIDGYLRDSPYFGAIVGRYANRIAGGRFTLDGVTYALARNNGPNHLHGGVRGFDKVVWVAAAFEDDSGVGVTLTHVSPDGTEGYPGTVAVRVSYALTPDDRLIVDYTATTDRATPINLSQHSYFNLAGHGVRVGDVLDHVLMIDASRYTPIDSTMIPTGALAPVEGTPFDFRVPTTIGARIEDPHEQLRYGGGYDHNFVLDVDERRVRSALIHAARVEHPVTGRAMDIYTTEPGLQFYSGNFLDGSIVGKAGQVYGHRAGFCLETQHFPDSPNQPAFPSTILRPGKEYRSRTVFAFEVMR
jgi:aldose 1-epimerase